MYAKTLYLPEKPKNVDEELKKFSKMKLPHFFVYAKDKEKNQVSSINTSTVNKLNDIIPDNRITFKQLVGEVDVKKLKKVKSRKVDLEIVERYKEINKAKSIIMDNEKGTEGFNLYVKNELLLLNSDINYVVDSLVEGLFNGSTASKDTFWEVFGEYVFKNLSKALGKTIQCETCITRFEAKVNESYCEECKKEIKKQQNKLADIKYREKLKR